MTPWKKLAVVSLCAGAGFALVIALVAGGYFWYQSRPKSPKAWNASAIKATFDYLDTEGDQNTLVFYYTLQNATPLDYELKGPSEFSVAARLQKENSLSFASDEKWLRVESPLFVPSGQRARFAVHVGYPYSEKRPLPSTSEDDRKKYREALNTYVEKHMGNLNGFVMFDQSRRYQIELPKGW